MKQLVLTICILLVFFVNSFASEKVSKIDSLIQIYIQDAENYTKTEQIDQLIKIGDALKHNAPDSAIFCYSIAIEVAKETSDNENRTKLLNRIGSAYYIQGVYDKALDNFVEALNMWRNAKHKNGVAIGLNNVALVYNMLGKNNEALEYHLNSVLLCKEIGDSVLLATNYFNIALINLNLQKYDTALIFARKSTELNTLLDNESELLKLCTLKGNIYNGKGEYLLAEEAFFKVVNKKNYDNKWEISYALAGLALTEQKLGNLDESISYGKRSLDMAMNIQAKWDIQNVTKIISDSYALKGDFKNAYEYYIEYKLYSDSIFNEEKDRKIDYLKLKHEDFEYILLAKDNEVQTQRINSKNNQMLIFAFGLIILFLISIFLIRTNRLKTKLNNQLRNKNAEIDKKNKELVQLNATKDTFFRILGHDLKSPMSTVVSFTDMLQNNYDQFSKEEILEYIGITKRSALDTIDLLENLLDWAKMQTGVTTVKPVKSNISKLINESIIHLHNVLIAKNINLITNSPEDIVVTLDRNMTASILRNLLSNAIKFTNENGEIQLRAEKDERGVLITISDNGIGMSKEKLDSLFHIETVSSSLGTKNEKGTGVGLILCKDFTQKQGGQLWAESEPGKGSTFYLRL